MRVQRTVNITHSLRCISPRRYWILYGRMPPNISTTNSLTYCLPESFFSSCSSIRIMNATVNKTEYLAIDRLPSISQTRWCDNIERKKSIRSVCRVRCFVWLFHECIEHMNERHMNIPKIQHPDSAVVVVVQRNSLSKNIRWFHHISNT